MNHAAHVVSSRDLTDDQNTALRDWWSRRTTDRPGLWICGPRVSGTSYIGQVVVNRLGDNPVYIRAYDLSQAIRKQWNLDDLARHFPDDTALWFEADDAQAKLATIRDCDLLWIDDFHDEHVDPRFWRKHIQPWVECRAKDLKTTIVCTTLTPDHPEMDGLERVIRGLFTVVHATR